MSFNLALDFPEELNDKIRGRELDQAEQFLGELLVFKLNEDETKNENSAPISFNSSLSSIDIKEGQSDLSFNFNFSDPLEVSVG